MAEQIEELDAKIAKLEAKVKPIQTDLEALRRQRRPLVAALASRLARRNDGLYEAIQREYAETKEKYGLMKALALKYNVSGRQLSRIVHEMKKRDFSDT